jgi:hypothetical protein
MRKNIMDNQEFRTLLEQLQNELESIDSVDENGQQLLHELDNEIHDLLQRSTTGNPLPKPSSVSRLEASIDYFEVTHPTLSATLVKLLAVLGNAGI